MSLYTLNENIIDNISNSVTETLPWTKKESTHEKPETVLDKTMRNTLRNGVYTPGEKPGEEEFRKKGNTILNTVKESMNMSYLDNLYRPVTESTTEDDGQKQEAIQEASKENKKDNDKPAWYNPIHLAGRAAGYIVKRADQGFEKGYGGSRRGGYGAMGYTAQQEAAEKTGISQGVGLGVPHATGNKLWQIPINQYQDSDASFVGDGEDPKTSQVNIPATLAARTAGGSPYGLTLNNGINKRTGDGYFKLKPLKDDLGQNG